MKTFSEQSVIKKEHIMKSEFEVLVVDDEETIAQVLSELLRDEGYRATSVFCGNHALANLRARRYQLVMLDLVLPDMHGIEMLRTIRAAFPKTDVIVMTSNASVETAVEALRLGASDYLFKPFQDLDIVSHVVRKIFEKQQSLAENERLHQELKARNEDLEVHVKRLRSLNESGRALHSILNIKELLSFTIQLMATELKAKRVSLMILDKRTNELVIEASVGIDAQVAQAVHVPVGAGIAGWVAQEGKALLVEDIEQDSRFKNQRDGSDYDSNSFISAPLLLSVPIQYQNTIIGVININNKEDGGVFTKSDLAFVSTLASQAAIAIENARIFEKLKEIHIEAITALAEALEAKDATTGQHSARLIQYAMGVADRLGLDLEAKEILRYASVLHDVGKIGVREQVLQKPGKLTPEEFEEMKQHPRLGASIVKKVAFLSSVAPAILGHHERYDGNGYPHGLLGESIPMEARIVSVMDSFDAMTSDRPYRKAPGKEYAIKELKAHAGSQFDPRVVEAFLAVLEENGKDAVPWGHLNVSMPWTA
jgi:response regulator RpfG family c-di-GMP phosphodiesterase